MTLAEPFLSGGDTQHLQFVTGQRVFEQPGREVADALPTSAALRNFKVLSTLERCEIRR